MIDYTTHNMEKNTRTKRKKVTFRKREQRCWNNKREDTCVNLYRIIKEEDISGNLEHVDENDKIYNSIFTFKVDMTKKF